MMRQPAFDRAHHSGILAGCAALVLLSALAAPRSVLAAPAWYLMARHGECAPISSLVRKFPDLGNIDDPQTFIRFVRAKGLAVSSADIAGSSGSALEVRVPEKGLSLVFVVAAMCSKIGTR